MQFLSFRDDPASGTIRLGGVPDLLALHCVCKGFGAVLQRAWQAKWNQLKQLQGVKTPSRRPNKPPLVLLLPHGWVQPIP